MLLERALRQAGYSHTPADIDRGVADGRFQRWDWGETVIITELLEAPQRKTCHFFLAEGRMEHLIRMTPFVLAWARQQGCTHATLAGREGWRRVPWLIQDGWHFAQIVMEKELDCE